VTRSAFIGCTARRPSRTPSSHNSSRIADGPAGRPVALGEHRIDAAEHMRCALGPTARPAATRNGMFACRTLAFAPGDTLSRQPFPVVCRSARAISATVRPDTRPQRQRPAVTIDPEPDGAQVNIIRSSSSSRTRVKRPPRCAPGCRQRSCSRPPVPFVGRTDSRRKSVAGRRCAPTVSTHAAGVVRHAVARAMPAVPRRMLPGRAVLGDGEITRPTGPARATAGPHSRRKTPSQVGHSWARAPDTPAQLPDLDRAERESSDWPT